MPKKLTTEGFIKRAKNKHGDKYDYSLVEYINNLTKVKIICPIHGIFEQIPHDHMTKSECKECGKEKSIKNRRNELKSLINKSNIIYDNNYSYNNIKNYTNMHTKYPIECLKHGIFHMDLHSHINKKRGCYHCAIEKRKDNKDTFIEKSNNTHNNYYNYSLVEYINSKKKVKIICPKHGIFEQKPNDHILGQGCPICRESKGEKYIRNYLIDNEIRYKIQKSFNNCKYKRKLKFDFYLPEYNTCIEYDGKQHFEPFDFFGGYKSLETIRKRDEIKNIYCKDNNIQLIRIKYDDNIIDRLNYHLK